MSDTIFKIKQIASLIIFVAVLSLMGMITQQPVMVIAYAVFFLVVVAVMFFLMTKRQRHFELSKESSPLFHRILGGILMLLAIAIPVYITLHSTIINLPSSLGMGKIIGGTLGATIAFIALILGAVYLINTRGSELVKRIIGYVLFVLGAALPGILMSRFDSTTTGIGSVYYVAMAVLILAYNGFGLLLNRD